MRAFMSVESDIFHCHNEGNYAAAEAEARAILVRYYLILAIPYALTLLAIAAGIL